MGSSAKSYLHVGHLESPRSHSGTLAAWLAHTGYFRTRYPKYLLALGYTSVSYRPRREKFNPIAWRMLLRVNAERA